MPKDWINLKLTGEYAQDYTEASLSFLMDQSTRDWSDELIALTGIPRNLLPPIRNPSEILGSLTERAANRLGLSPGIPVLVGAGDYPTALLGSGVCGARMGSDVTGTSTIMTLSHNNPVMHPGVSNLLEPSGNWGSFTLLDAGAMRCDGHDEHFMKTGEAIARLPMRQHGLKLGQTRCSSSRISTAKGSRTLRIHEPNSLA